MPNQKHAVDTAIYSISKAFERASFYGVRALLILYLLETFHNNSREQTIELFGWFLLAVAISKIIGALIGDLLIKTKYAIIIGGFLQTLGCFIICFNANEIILIGMGIIALGSGLYGPNILAQFARFYIKKPKIIDSAFTIYFTAINIGSFLGTFLIGIVGEHYGYIYGFFVAGACMLVSTTIVLLHREKQLNLTSLDLQPKIGNKALILLICFVTVALFWSFYDFSSIAFQDIKLSIGTSTSYSSDVNPYSWDIINSSVALLFAGAASIVWSFLYYDQLTKIVIGTLSLSIGLSIFIFIGTPYSDDSMIIVVLATIIIGFAEVHINPILNSMITRSINPKFLAIALGLSFIPGLLIGKLFTAVGYDYIAKLNNSEILLVGISGLGAMGLILLVLMKLGVLNTTNAVRKKH